MTLGLFHLNRWYQLHSWLLVLDGELDFFSNYLDRILYDASILNKWQEVDGIQIQADFGWLMTFDLFHLKRQYQPHS